MECRCSARETAATRGSGQNDDQFARTDVPGDRVGRPCKGRRSRKCVAHAGGLNGGSIDIAHFLMPGHCARNTRSSLVKIGACHACPERNAFHQWSLTLERTRPGSIDRSGRRRWRGGWPGDAVRMITAGMRNSECCDPDRQTSLQIAIHAAVLGLRTRAGLRRLTRTRPQPVHAPRTGPQQRETERARRGGENGSVQSGLHSSADGHPNGEQ